MEEDDDYQEPPWQGNAVVAAHQHAHQINIGLRPEFDGPDEFTGYLGTLRALTPDHFPIELYQLIQNEVTGLYNTWLKGLRGQPLETSIVKTMENIGFFDRDRRKLVIPDASVAVGNEQLDAIDEGKKKLNYVIHRLQEYRLSTGGGTALPAAAATPSFWEEETKDDGGLVEAYQGQHITTIHSVVGKLVMLAGNLYKVMDSATIMSMNFTNLLENAHPDKWYRVNDLEGCEYQKFLLLDKPIAMEDSKKFDKHTRLVIYLLDKFRERKFRKKPTSDHLYQQIFFTRDDGSKVCTYAFAPIKESIEQLVYNMVRKEFRGDLWSTILHCGILKDCVTYIKKCVDDEVPDVNEKPLMWSFMDGIYCAETDTFSYYENARDTFPVLAHGYSTYKFMEGHFFAPVYFLHDPPTPVATRFHRDDDDDSTASFSPRPSPRRGHGRAMDEEDSMSSFEDDPPEVRKRSLEDIAMPNLVKIFKDQGWSDETIFLKLATLGRTFWPCGALDCMQFWPCDWGVGGSGKSTVQDVFKYLFHWQDVGIFGADQEDTFSRDSLPDKRIIIAPEVRGDNFGCSLAFFLSIVASDSVRIPVKYGQPRDVENFPVQGLMATNELPKSYLNDPKGSVARRILVFPWPRVIIPRDPTLKGRIIKDELPAILRACVVAYHRLPKTVDVMSDYPLAPEMAAARAKLQRASNSMVDFLLSEDFVSLGEHQRVELDTLRKSYNHFVKEVRNERQLPAWNEDLYDYPFRLLRLQLEAGDENNPAYVLGCSVRVEIQ